MIPLRAPRTLDEARGGFAADVRRGLTDPAGKWLPARHLYDPLGSALFEAICLLPEYGVARADQRVLERAAPELAERLGPRRLVVELGSGTGRKTRRLLGELSRHGPLVYQPIDLSASALEQCRAELADVPGVRVQPVEADFLVGLAAAPRRPGEPLLVLFLGSTIGNFDRPAAARFLRELRARLRPGDALLLGTDLQQPVPRMLAAYDDPTGVTAAFDLNLLGRINRELGGEFDLAAFAHEARWSAERRQIEMHLRARHPQIVRVRAVGVQAVFREGETIWTEASCKYAPDEPARLAAPAGFQAVTQWIDAEWPFAESLFVVA